MPLGITAFYLGLLSPMLAILIVRIVRLRWTLRVGIGDGGHPELQRAIRVHGNFVETVPLMILMLAMLEINRILPAAGLHIFGGLIVAARLLHAWGLTRRSGASRGRFIGMVLTLSLILTGAGLCLWHYLGTL